VDGDRRDPRGQPCGRGAVRGGARAPSGVGEKVVKNELDALDRVLEHRVRLAACVLLTRYDRLSFSRLKALTDETDGNLGANLRKLEDEGLVAVTKEFVDRKPVSWYAITAKGRKTLKTHLDVLGRIIAQAGKPGKA
jgi:DNA-binding MarR family transcriptional regulator